MAQDFTSDPNIQAYWYMEDAPGTSRLDGTANANSLTDNNTVGRSSNRKQNLYSAAFNGANYLHRTDANLSTGFVGKIGSSNTDLTVGLWVYFNTIQPGHGTRVHFMGKGNPNTFDFVVETDGGNNQISFSVYDGSNFYGSYADNVNTFPNIWYHVVGRFSGSTSREVSLSVNGVKQASTATTAASTVYTNAQSLTIGTLNSFQGMLDGLIDEAFIFNRALSDAEILSIYSFGLAGTGVFTPPPSPEYDGFISMSY